MGQRSGLSNPPKCFISPWLTVVQVVLKSARKDDANLAREIHHHRQFLHPHIARLYEVIVTENLVWLVLEYCPGIVKKFLDPLEVY